MRSHSFKIASLIAAFSLTACEQQSQAAYQPCAIDVNGTIQSFEIEEVTPICDTEETPRRQMVDIRLVDLLSDIKEILGDISANENDKVRFASDTFFSFETDNSFHQIVKLNSTRARAAEALSYLTPRERDEIRKDLLFKADFIERHKSQIVIFLENDMQYGKGREAVPTHTYLDSVQTWLEDYARIISGIKSKPAAAASRGASTSSPEHSLD